ncbi:MAG: restriction endonuclease subunit S [Micrococcaceae bacterium]
MYEAWLPQKLGKICRSYSGGTPSVKNHNYYIGNIPFIRSGEINSESTELLINETAFNHSSVKMVSRGDILYALYGATSGEVAISKINGAINQAILAIKPECGHDTYYIYTWLNKQRKKLLSTYLQGGQGNLSGTLVKSFRIYSPLEYEQEKIGEFFKKIDSLIAKHTQKLELLKKLKKGYLQKIFSQELRFRGFTDSWQEHRFQEIFNYERPDKYIVSDTNYVKNGVPVLTANKSFTLGYTQEKDFYEKVPCIIFDDFTLDSKYVDFPFKVKSSALKILNVKDSYDIRFAFELLNITRIPKEGHSRHYISIVQKKKIFSPKTLEQGEIGNFCNTIYNLLTMNSKKLDTLKQTKRAYLQKMFI